MFCTYYCSHAFFKPERDIAGPLSDFSVVKLPFFVCCTPLCFEHLLMADTGLATVPLLIRFLRFPFTSPKEKTQPQIPSKCFVFPFKNYNFPCDGNGYVFFLIIHLLLIGTHVQSKKNANNTVQHSEKEYLLN